jgi:tRNA nucleotidyltransferase (CCA-adding enzyme)
MELYNLLLSEKPSEQLKTHEKELFTLIPELSTCKGFNQNNEWHIYDVYEHILHVIDNVPSNIVMRLTALFHDIGKPLSYIEDENKVGHFYGHWEVSQKIFTSFAEKNNIDHDISERVSNLIYYHDINVSKLNENELKEMFQKLNYDGIEELYEFKKADLLAQNEKYHYILDEYPKQKEEILNKLKKSNS